MGVKYDFSSLRDDTFGGLTAAVIALPLSLAFGVASGLGAIAGLYGAIAVGFFATVFGGTKTQISGPTAPLAVAMSVVVTSYADSLTEALTIAALAGLIQILLGALRLGSFVAYTPYPVISGFTTGVGAIIILVQSLPFLGAPVALGGPLASVRRWPEVVNNINPSALVLAVVTVAVGVLWPPRLRKILPPAVAALLVGTFLGIVWLQDVPVIGEVPTGLPTIRIPGLSIGTLLGALLPAVTIALIGSINSLLTALIADSMTQENHDPNRELIGVGLGNVLAGLIGAVPGAGATTGTVANIQAGGRSRVSGILCATILLALVLGLGKYVGTIPHAVLAGILMKIGFDILDRRFLTRFRYIQREQFVVMMLTLGFTVFVDLVIAVAIGLIAAAMTSARQFERLELDSVVSVPLLDSIFLGMDDDSDDFDPFSARVGLVSLRGTFTVASSRKLITTIGMDIRDHEVVILDFSKTVYMDDSAALVVERLIATAQADETDCIVMGLAGLAATGLQALDVLRNVPGDHFVETMDDAREVARRPSLTGGRAGRSALRKGPQARDQDRHRRVARRDGGRLRRRIALTGPPYGMRREPGRVPHGYSRGKLRQSRTRRDGGIEPPLGEFRRLRASRGPARNRGGNTRPRNASHQGRDARRLRTREDQVRPFGDRYGRHRRGPRRAPRRSRIHRAGPGWAGVRRHPPCEPGSRPGFRAGGRSSPGHRTAGSRRGEAAFPEGVRVRGGNRPRICPPFLPARGCGLLPDVRSERHRRTRPSGW